MRIINIFPETKAWSDIVRMLFAIEQQVEESVIISRDEIPLPEGATNTRFIVSPPGVRGIRFFFWAAKTARELVDRSSDPSKWVVMEHTGGVALFFLKYLLRSKCRTVVYFVFPPIKFLLENGWNVDPWARPLTARQQLFYFADHIKRSVIALASLAGADFISGNSHEILESYRPFKPHGPRALLPNPVTPVAPLSVKRSDSPVASDFEIIFVAMMQPHKGVACALEIFFRFREKNPNARLTLVGGCLGPDKPWLDRLLDTYRRKCGDSISYLGRVPFDELWQIYSRARLFLFPTYYEGSPRVVQEALQYGCPVVTTDISGNRVIDPQGEILQFFNPGDVPAAVAILQRLAADPAELDALRERSRYYVRTHFTPEKVGQTLLSIYSDVLRIGSDDSIRNARVDRHVAVNG